jgi:hypothetical protein
VGDGSRPCQYSLLQEGRRRLPHSTAFQATLEQCFYQSFPFFFGFKGTTSRDWMGLFWPGSLDLNPNKTCHLIFFKYATSFILKQHHFFGECKKLLAFC